MGRDEEVPVPFPVIRTGNKNPPLTRKLQILYTIAIMFGNLTFGCTFTFYSPALKDFQTKFGVETDEISKVFTIILICYCIGALTSGIYYNYINRQLAVTVFFGGMAASMFVSPHCPNITVFFVVGGFLGYCLGTYDCAQVVWMMEIWQSKAGPFVQAQHFCYALGTNIPPLLLAPFLSDTEDEDDLNGNVTTTFSSTTFSGETEESRVYIPFSVAGALNACACLFQLFLFIFYRYRTPPTEEEVEYNNKLQVENKSMDEASFESSNNSSQDALDSATKVSKPFNLREVIKTINWPRMRLIAITAMFLGAYQGMEMCTMQFVPTFGQKSDLHLTESKSATVLSGLTAAFAAGRFIGIFIILKVAPVLMLCLNICLIVSANIILLIWAKTNLTMLWTGCILMGAGFSTVFASFTVFIERHLVFTNAVGAAMIVSGSGIAAIYPLIVGESIDNNVVVLTYTNFFSIALCCTALLLALKVTHRQAGRLL